MDASRRLLIRSVNELGAQVQKAARGAGLPVGHAQDMGHLAVHMGINGKPLAVMLTALQAPLTPLAVVWMDDAITFEQGHPVLIALAARDAFEAGTRQAHFQEDQQMQLVGPLLASAGIKTTINHRSITVTGTQFDEPAKGPVDIDNDIWDGFAALAAKTYVPATDASRLAGAGASLSDND